MEQKGLNVDLMMNLIKPFLVLTLFFNMSTAVSGDFNLISTVPSSPTAGDNITVVVQAVCPFSAVVQNAQGLTHLFEFENPLTLSLTAIHADVGCVGAPPAIPITFELGALNEGIYTLDVFFASEANTLPTQNRQLLSTTSFQVGAGLQPVNTLSDSALLLLIFAVLCISYRLHNNRPT